MGCGFICTSRVPLLEEFGYLIKDQVEINCKDDGGKEAKNLWNMYRAYGWEHWAGHITKSPRSQVQEAAWEKGGLSQTAG